MLDTCYLTGGFGAPLSQPQRRFSDGDAAGWLDRVERHPVYAPKVRLAAAIHSVRAVPPAAMGEVAGWAVENAVPLHVHLSEQRAENEGCLGTYGCTPARLLSTSGVLGENTTVIHATHARPTDIALLGRSGTGVCLCPSTEAELADGIGPAAALATAGAPLSLGTDAHALTDPFHELRAVESTQRLLSETRGHFDTAMLFETGAGNGHRALGWFDAGWIEVGARADLVALDLGVRHAGVPIAEVPTIASAGDVRDVFVDGQCVVRDRTHQRIGDVRRLLATAVADVVPWREEDERTEGSPGTHRNW